MKTGETDDIYKKDIITEYMRLLDYLGLQITTVAFTVRGCRGWDFKQNNSFGKFLQKKFYLEIFNPSNPYKFVILVFLWFIVIKNVWSLFLELWNMQSVEWLCTFVNKVILGFKNLVQSNSLECFQTRQFLHLV